MGIFRKLFGCNNNQNKQILTKKGGIVLEKTIAKLTYMSVVEVSEKSKFEIDTPYYLLETFFENKIYKIWLDVNFNKVLDKQKIKDLNTCYNEEKQN